MPPAGPDGETGQSSLWRRLREPEEPLSQTAAVSGDGKTIAHRKLQHGISADGPLTYVKTCLQVTDNISQNTILEYVMINSIFEAILQVGGQWKMCFWILLFLSVRSPLLSCSLFRSCRTSPVEGSMAMTLWSFWPSWSTTGNMRCVLCAYADW